MAGHTKANSPSAWRRFMTSLTDLAYAMDATPQELHDRRLKLIEQRLAVLEDKGQLR